MKSTLGAPLAGWVGVRVGEDAICAAVTVDGVSAGGYVKAAAVARTRQKCGSSWWGKLQQEEKKKEFGCLEEVGVLCADGGRRAERPRGIGGLRW